MKNCYYKILGVSIRASQDDIKKAFRLLALRWHPDKNPRDPRAAERFREALNAYETLVDPSRRTQYDRARGYRRRKAGAGRGAGEEPREHRSPSKSEIFEDFFGIRAAASVERRSTDLRFDLQVPRSALGQGLLEEIEYVRVVFCQQCLGNGRRMPSSSCEVCHGSGEVDEHCTVKVWIPQGSEQGARLRVPGGGDRRYPGCAAGDLVVMLQVVEA